MRFLSISALAALLVLLTVLAYLPDTQAHQVNILGDVSSRHSTLMRRQFEDVNNKDPNANESHYYAELSKPPYGLYIWTNIARLTRVSLRNGKDHMPIPVKDGEFAFDQKATIMYFIPFIVFLGCLLLTCVANCCTGCCLCTCKKKRLARRQKDPFTTRQRVFAAIGLAFVFFCWCVAVVGGIRGSMLFGRSLAIMGETMNHTFTDGRGLAASFKTDIFSALDAIALTVNDTADSVVDYIPAEGISDIQTQILLLADQAQFIADNVTALQNSAGDLEDIRQNLAVAPDNVLSALINDIIDSTDAVQALIDDPKEWGTGTNKFYAWTGPQDPMVVFTPYTINDSPLKEVEDARTTLAGMGSATTIIQNTLQDHPMPSDLSTLIAKAREIGGDLLQTIRNVPQDQINTVKDTAATQLAPVKADLSVMFDPIDTTIGDYQDTADKYYDMVKKYELYRNIAFIVIFALPVVIIVFVAGGVGGRRPGLVKGCLCGAIPYTIIALLLTILFLLFSVIFGEVCTVAFTPDATTGRPAAADALVVLSADMGDIYVKAMNARAQCFTGESAVQVVKAFIDVPDFTATVNDTVDGLSSNFDDVTANIDTSSVLAEMPANPSGAATAATNAQDTVDNYDFSSTLASLDTQLGNLQTVVQYIIDNVLVGHGTHGEIVESDVDYGTGPWDVAGSQERQDAAAELNTRFQALKDHFQALLDDQTLSFQKALALKVQIADQYDVMKGHVDNLVDTAVAITQPTSGTYDTMRSQITDYINNKAIPTITSSIPTILNDIKSKVTIALNDNVYYGPTSCSEVAKDTMDIQMGICDGVLTSFDSMWFAWFILGSVGALAVPIFINAANMLADKDAKKPKSSKKGGKGGKKDDHKKGDKGGKGDNDKDSKGKKGKDDVEAGQVKWNSAKVAPAPTDPSQGHPTIAKTGQLVPGETGSPIRGQPPAPEGLYPSLDLPQYHHEMYHSPPQGHQMPAQDFDEMRPAWLGGEVESVNPAYSPRPQHPHAVPQSFSNHSMLEPSAPGIHSPQGSHPSNSLYGEVTKELGKRLSMQGFDMPQNGQPGQRTSQYNPQQGNQRTSQYNPQYHH